MISFNLISICFGLNLFLTIETRIIKEMDNFHFGYYLFLSLDFGKTEKGKFNNFFREEFENIYISSQEMDEIKNQINYLLEDEDELEEENEINIDLFEENNTDSVDYINNT